MHGETLKFRNAYDSVFSFTTFHAPQ